jgi:hypothetical protein
VSSRPHARATRVERVGDGAVERPLLPDFLGRGEAAERPVPFDIREFRSARYGSARRD